MMGLFFPALPFSGASKSPEKPSISVVNSDARITITSDDPVTVLSGQIELATPSKLHISGVVSGTFEYVCGLAVYVNDTPLHKGTGVNDSHPDCMQIMYGNGGNNSICPVPFDLSTNELSAGMYVVKIAVISRWLDTKRTMYVNNRSAGDMSSSSTLTVRAI